MAQVLDLDWLFTFIFLQNLLNAYHMPNLLLEFEEMWRVKLDLVLSL